MRTMQEGLRDCADIIDKIQEQDLGCYPYVGVFGLHIAVFDSTNADADERRRTVAALVKIALPYVGKLDKRYEEDGDLRLKGDLADGVELHILGQKVCQAKVVGTKTVDVVEWDCGDSLLASLPDTITEPVR